MTAAAPVTLRTELRPGDIGQVVSFHGRVYAQEYGFDHTFEAYVAGPLAAFVRSGSPRGRVWLAERAGELVGCIAIVECSASVAQLRWYLVDPTARGRGLGTTLLNEALGFCRICGYRSVVLWTVRALTAAAHLYRVAGFALREEKAATLWGVEVIEERYEMTLGEPPPPGDVDPPGREQR